mgnify:CR=1 FL=1
MTYYPKEFIIVHMDHWILINCADLPKIRELGFHFSALVIETRPDFRSRVADQINYWLESGISIFRVFLAWILSFKLLKNLLYWTSIMTIHLFNIISSIFEEDMPFLYQPEFPIV